MYSVGRKLIFASTGTFRRLLLSKNVFNPNTFQVPLSCLACRQVQMLDDGPEVKNTAIRFILKNASVYSIRFQSSAPGSEGTVGAMENKVENGGTWIDKTIKVLKVVAAPLVKKTVLVGGARNMYECCVEGMNFEEFFEALELPDTLQSWFLVLHLHIWMCLVRLKAEGKDGRYMYKTLVRMMWLDVEERIDNLGTIDSVQKRDTLQVLQQQFNGLSIGYDEGLLCDDRVLATVLWRNLFQNKNRTDAEQLGRLVEYIRKNIQHLDSLPTEHVLQDGRITWLPLNEQLDEENKKDND